VEQGVKVAKLGQNLYWSRKVEKAVFDNDFNVVFWKIFEPKMKNLKFFLQNIKIWVVFCNQANFCKAGFNFSGLKSYFKMTLKMLNFLIITL
jgi:hypothetical protein